MTRESWRRLRMGLVTVTGVARQGFFIPYRYADTIPGPGQRPPYAAIEALLEARRATFTGLLERAEGYADALRAIAEGPAPEPRWLQNWFPRLDAAIAYVLTRETKPAHIVEIGSGHSTRFYARAVRDGGLETEITCIDPAPRADIARLGAEIIRAPVQHAGLDAFGRLAAGDFLVIDSSHILMPGTDVDLLFNVVLPELPAGVRVHIHDIFLPDDYPESWGWRGYNEQQGVAALLQGGGYEIEWASRFVATRMAGDLAESVIGGLPILPDVFESSLWLRKRP